MNFQVSKMLVPSIQFQEGKKFSKTLQPNTISQFVGVKIVIFLLVIFLIGCQGQTFQYSRGWTNGKRNGYHPIRNNMISVNDLPESSSLTGEGTLGINSGQIPFAEEGISINPNFRNGGRVEYKQSKALNGQQQQSKPILPIWIFGIDQENNSSGET